MNLYRQYLKLHKKWPKQPARAVRFDVYLEKTIHKQFRNPTINGSQLEALQDLLNDKYEKLYPITRIRDNLPGKKTFGLLDRVGQTAIERSRSPFAMLKGYLIENEKLRNQ